MAGRFATARGAIGVRIAASAFGSASQAALLLLLARDLGPAGFAPFGQFMALVYLSGTALSFGFGVHALRLGSSEEARRTLGTMVAIRLATSFALVVVVGSCLGQVWPGNVALFIAASALMVNELFAELVQSGLSGQGAPNLASGLMVAQRLIGSLIPSLVGLTTSHWWASIVAGQTLAFVLLLGFAVSRCAWPRRPSRVVHSSAGFWVASVIPSLGQADSSIAHAVSGAFSTGVISAGSRMTAPFSILSNAILAVLVPRFAARSGDAGADGSAHRDVGRAVRYVAVYSLVLAAAAPVVALIFLQVLGSDYQAGFWYFTALVVAAALSAITQVYQAWLFSCGRTRTVTWALGWGIFTGLAVLTLGLLVGGITGAAFGPVVCQLVILAQFHSAYRSAAD